MFHSGIKTFGFISFIIVSLNLFAGNVTISGKISNPASDVICVSPDVFLPDSECYTADVNMNGEFKLEFELPLNGYYRFKHGREYSIIYLETGFDLFVQLNTEEFDESLKFEGKGAKVNNYLASKYLINEKLQGDFDSFYGFEPDLFLKKNLQIRQTIEKEFLSLCSDEEISPEFKNMERSSITYQWADDFLKYILYHGNFSNKELQVLKNVKNNYMLLNDSVPDLLKVAPYRTYFMDLINYKAARIKDTSQSENSRDDIQWKWKAVKSTLILNKNIQDFLYASLLIQHIKYTGTEGIDNLILDLDSLCNNEKYRQSVHNELELWKDLKSGNSAPDFTYADSRGKEYSLHNFKGKYVYIDSWASWCGPCKKEIPYLKKLEEELKSYNIEIIGISLDTDKNAWKKILNDKELSGIQLYANGFNSEFALNYNIKSIPRFILIDPSGNIIDVNAKRPSEGVVDTIKSLKGIKQL